MKSFPAVFLLLCASTPAFAAAPTLERLFPPGGERGKTVKVTASGKFPSGTIGAWCDRDEITLTLGGKKSSSRTLSIAIPKDATPGVCWIRLYNAEGASALKPFVVGTIAEVNEQEPNNRLTESIPLFTKPTTVNGALSKSRDVDCFAVQLAEGQTLVAAMTAHNTLGSPMDGVLQVVSENGFILAQNDDHHGFDPRIVFRAPSGGKYFVRTFAFPATPNSSVRFAGAANYIYRLTITAGPYVDYTYPLAVRRSATEPVRLHGWNLPPALRTYKPQAPPDADAIDVVAPGLANTVSFQRVDADTFTEKAWQAAHSKRAGEIPAVISGRLAGPGETDRYRIRAKKGRRLKIAVASRALGFPTDPVLKVTDLKGKTIQRVETRSSTAIDETAQLTIPADGEYVVEVSDLHRRGGTRYVYRLSIQENVPSYQLSVKSDVFQLTPGKPLTIPVTVARERGFRGEVAISAAGLPPGVAAKTVKSMSKGATAKSVKLVLTADAKSARASGGVFRIVGTVKGSTKKTAAAPIATLTDTTDALWLTVAAPKKPAAGTAQKKQK